MGSTVVLPERESAALRRGVAPPFGAIGGSITVNRPRLATGRKQRFEPIDGVALRVLGVVKAENRDAKEVVDDAANPGLGFDRPSSGRFERSGATLPDGRSRSPSPTEQHLAAAVHHTNRYLGDRAVFESFDRLFVAGRVDDDRGLPEGGRVVCPS